MSYQKDEIALEFNNLTKRYGDLTAVDNISIKIVSGQVYGILGPNGAGKSTTIKIIAGLLKADEGCIKIFGRDPHSDSALSLIGLCPQELVVWDGLTLMEQLIFMANMYNVPVVKAREKAQELLSRMGLEDKKNKLASTLSGGMKRRLNILLAVMHDPEIIILDEPQAGLDPQSRLLVREYIKELADKKKTVIITTHDMEEADKVAERVAIMDGGRILVEDTPEELKKAVFPGELLEFSIEDVTGMNIQNILKSKIEDISFNGNNVRIVCDNPLDMIRELKDVLKEKKARMEDIKIRKGTLEDVFITLTGRGLRE